MGGQWQMQRNELADLFAMPNLRAAFERVRARRGAPGPDHQTIEQFAAHLNRNLARLQADITSGRYTPAPVRRVFLPKRSGGLRPLGIPNVRDRVAQAVVHDQCLPYWEERFLDCSYAYRPGRSIFDAIAQVEGLHLRGLQWVLEADIVKCFDRLDHALLKAYWRAAHPQLTELVSSWLTAGAVDGDRFVPTPCGIPQGGVISPLLCNVYLHQLDQVLIARGHHLVRYADDFVIVCASEAQAHAALRDAATALARIKLQLSSPKTGITTFDQGFEFLGAQFRGAQVRRPRTGRYAGVAKPALARGARSVATDDPDSAPQPIWLTCRPPADDYLPISAVGDFAWCARSFYLRHLCGEDLRTPRMQAGQHYHRIRRLVAGNDSLLFDVPVAADSLRLRGRLDAVFSRWNTWVPIEFKFAFRPVVRHRYRLQLAAQALAIEETTGRRVCAGYVEFLPGRESECVIIDAELRAEVRRVVEHMHNLARAPSPPEAPDTRQCGWCSMRPVCQPELAADLEAIIA